MPFGYLCIKSDFLGILILKKRYGCLPQYRNLRVSERNILIIKIHSLQPNNLLNELRKFLALGFPNNNIIWKNIWIVVFCLNVTLKRLKLIRHNAIIHRNKRLITVAKQMQFVEESDVTKRNVTLLFDSPLRTKSYQAYVPKNMFWRVLFSISWKESISKSMMNFNSCVHTIWINKYFVYFFEFLRSVRISTVYSNHGDKNRSK